MDKFFATQWQRFFSAVLLLNVATPFAVGHQFPGAYATTSGALATYEYHAGAYQVEMLPLDAIIVFSGDDPTTMLTATFYKPIIGALADGTPLFPIGAVIPLTVTGTSSNGRDFTGDLLGTQYLFDWAIEPAGGGELVWSGVVGWAGGRYEQTTISSARLVPVDADFDDDGDVDGADFLTWQRGLGATSAAHAQGDTNGDGSVTSDDLAIWRRLAGTTAALTAAVPEPSASVIVAAACLCLGCINMAARNRP